MPPPQQAPSYAASPLGSFPELSQMYATSFSSPLSGAQAGAGHAQDKTSIDNANQAAQDAQARAEAFTKKENYTVQQRQDGGFGFYGPDGKEISAAQYAQNTGQKLTDVLKDSQNPIDQRYINDQNSFIKYLQAKAASKYDPKQAAIAKQIEAETSPLLKKQYGVDMSQISPVQFRSIIQQNYPTIYGGTKPGISGASNLLPGYGTANAQVEANAPLNGYYPTNTSSDLAKQTQKKG